MTGSADQPVHVIGYEIKHRPYVTFEVIVETILVPFGQPSLATRHNSLLVHFTCLGCSFRGRSFTDIHSFFFCLHFENHDADPFLFFSFRSVICSSINIALSYPGGVCPYPSLFTVSVTPGAQRKSAARSTVCPAMMNLLEEV